MHQSSAHRHEIISRKVIKELKKRTAGDLRNRPRDQAKKLKLNKRDTLFGAELIFKNFLC